MSQLSEVGGWVEERLPKLLADNGVPAAAVAIMAGDEIVDTASGVLSKATGVEATTDSVFQVGSITKLWTSTLIMQLVDEGRLELDATVRSYLPEFRIADEDAAAAITVRQLLCHVAGFEGDIFTDTGRGDDCVEKYVATLADVPQLFAPGEMFSYNNAGFCVLGRVVEVLRGKPYEQCLREQLITPLGLTHTAHGPHEAIMYRAAVGHIPPAPDADPVPAPVWALAPSNAPAGSMLTMRARDLLGFARMHLSDGAGPDGTSVLSAASARAMRARQVELPELGLMGDAWGLGFELFDFPGGPVIGHDGGTIGQNAFLRIVPDRNVAVSLLTNGGNPMPLYTELVGTVLRELAGVELPAMPVPADEPPAVDASRYLGTYSSSVADQVVSQDDEGRIWLERTPKGIFVELGEPVTKLELVSWRGDTMLPREPEHGLHTPHAFVGAGAGPARYLHTGRADPRVSS
ncbi:serine hydrolase domain-containing protein [Actinocatenispora sera]|uniref:Serine hydrolase n=1 Tax=Actinocatenispora sera TaxID=390989 RepID=A0A810L3X9_9ACTN|nr:serine hydrolase domain-containing protein [Actinocatenispora sera]BCJ28848.1 serine hydrolase [Actinocatenispora sera]